MERMSVITCHSAHCLVKQHVIGGTN